MDQNKSRNHGTKFKNGPKSINGPKIKNGPKFQNHKIIFDTNKYHPIMKKKSYSLKKAFHCSFVQHFSKTKKCQQSVCINEK